MNSYYRCQVTPRLALDLWSYHSISILLLNYCKFRRCEQTLAPFWDFELSLNCLGRFEVHSSKLSSIENCCQKLNYFNFMHFELMSY